MSVESELAELRNRLDALEQAPTEDQLGPNAFALNAQGEVEERLTGRLEARGINFAAGTGPAASIRWLLGMDPRAVIRANASPEEEAIVAELLRLGAQRIILQLLAGEASSEAGLSVKDKARAASATLLTSQGQSSFLQLPAVRKLTLKVPRAEELGLVE